DAADIFQDLNGGLVGPVVDDVAQMVRIRTGRHRFHKIAADELRTVRYTFAIDGGAASIDYVCLVEEYAAHLWTALHDSRQHVAVSGADVSKCGHFREVIRVEHRGSFRAMKSVHRGIEDLGVFGTRTEVFKQGLTKRDFKRALGRSNTIDQSIGGAGPHSH